MLKVLGCITLLHDLRLVLLAGVLCLFACTTAMSMVIRARESSRRMRMFWLAAAGCVAGCGIWGTHFVAMLAFQTGLPVGYDPGLTILSVIVAAVLSAGGFHITLHPKRALLGGALVGAAISTMHYIGMAAVRAPADAVWDMNYVTASVVIGVILTAVAMHLALNSKKTSGGIAAKDIPKAFERFGQVDSSLSRRYEGASLGLPLAKHLVELHGGRIELESEEGLGTTVTLFLPDQRLVEKREAA